MYKRSVRYGFSADTVFVATTRIESVFDTKLGETKLKGVHIDLLVNSNPNLLVVS